MKFIFINVAVISGLLLLATPSFAQEHDRARVLQKVRHDVNQESLFSGQDQYSVAQTNRDLDELQSYYAACQCDQGAFDQPAFLDLISTLQKAMRDDRVRGRDYEILQEDVNLLRGTPYSDTQAYAK